MPLGYGGGPGRFGAGDRPGTRSVGALAPVGRVTARSPAPGPGSGLGNGGRAVCLAPRRDKKRPGAGSGPAKVSWPPRQAPVALRIWGSAHAEASRPVEGGGLMWSGTRVAALAGMAALVAAGVAACGQQRGARPGAAQATGGPAGAVHAGQAAYAATMKARTATLQLVETGQAERARGGWQRALVPRWGPAGGRP